MGPNNEVYALGDDTHDVWGSICTLKNAFNGGVQAADCTTPAVTPSPSAGPRVYVGPALSQWPAANMACQLQGGQKYKCFDTYGLRSIASDPITPYKVYIAYVAGAPPAPSSPGIYFTQSTGSGGWGAFTNPPVTVAVNTSTVIYYDPQVTVDTDGTIIVLYMGVNVAPADTSGAATMYYKVWVPGASGFAGPYTLTNWNTSTIQYACGRGEYFVGDFMAGKAFGARAFLNFPYNGSTSVPYNYRTTWVNQWNQY